MARARLAFFLGELLGELAALEIMESVGVGTETARERRTVLALIENELRDVGVDRRLQEYSRKLVQVELDSYIASRPPSERSLFNLGKLLKFYVGMRAIENQSASARVRVEAAGECETVVGGLRKVASQLPDLAAAVSDFLLHRDDEDWFTRFCALEETVIEKSRGVSLGDSVDVAIVTMRDDEFRAVLRRFPPSQPVVSGRREYNVHCGLGMTAIVLRTIRQGGLDAGDAVRDLLEDFPPRLVVLAGIAGARPDDDFSLGDVVVSTHIHDFSLEAREYGKNSAFDDMGGPLNRDLGAFIANLAARDLGSWNTLAAVGERPGVVIDATKIYGPEDWQRKVRESLELHFRTPRLPRVVTGPIAASDNLVKDPDLLIQWLSGARSTLAIEMESAGAYHASNGRVPFLAVRGISDIVGFKRDGAWTAFACESAASALQAILRVRAGQ